MGMGWIAVKGAYTYDEPRAGTEVEVLWAPSAPELGGRQGFPVAFVLVVILGDR